jgi:hypothetical protein
VILHIRDSPSISLLKTSMARFSLLYVLYVSQTAIGDAKETDITERCGAETQRRNFKRGPPQRTS